MALEFFQNFAVVSSSEKIRPELFIMSSTLGLLFNSDAFFVFLLFDFTVGILSASQTAVEFFNHNSNQNSGHKSSWLVHLHTK